MMKFRNLELDFDLFDAETAEAYESAVERVQDGNANRPDSETLAQAIRRQCGLVFDFFDDLFGEGFHRQLFGDRTNLTDCVDVFSEFINTVNAQKSRLDERINKYTPNRAMRRAVAEPGKK